MVDVANGNGNRWSFNYRQLTIIAVLLINTLWVGWWAASTTQRVEALERNMIPSDRVTRIETKLDDLAKDVGDIKQFLVNPSRKPL